MAVQKEEKKNRVLQAISHEWKYENLILVILALFALELGVLLLTGDLDFAQNVFLLSDYKTVFAWILVGLGVVALLLAVSSFYRPSISEIKHVTGLKKKEFFVNVVTVFVFILVLVGLIMAYDSLIQLVKGLFN
ncbi:MAG: preprotein translocase subunit SecE [Bacilli bacterium]|jgi:preprotein translocase subunit SecE|nr:preprotein translocase subunit SecE [Bacilli bacterium]